MKVTVSLPDPEPQSDLYDVHFNVASDDDYMKGPRQPRVCIDAEGESIYQVCTPTAHITPAEARSLATALLAAAEYLDGLADDDYAT